MVLKYSKYKPKIDYFLKISEIVFSSITNIFLPVNPISVIFQVAFMVANFTVEL